MDVEEVWWCVVEKLINMALETCMEIHSHAQGKLSCRCFRMHIFIAAENFLFFRLAHLERRRLSYFPSYLFSPSRLPLVWSSSLRCKPHVRRYHLSILIILMQFSIAIIFYYFRNNIAVNFMRVYCISYFLLFFFCATTTRWHALLGTYISHFHLL